MDRRLREQATRRIKTREKPACLAARLAAFAGRGAHIVCRGLLVGGAQIFVRIDGHVVDADFVVEVGAGGTARHADCLSHG